MVWVSEYSNMVTLPSNIIRLLGQVLIIFPQLTISKADYVTECKFLLVC